MNTITFGKIVNLGFLIIGALAACVAIIPYWGTGPIFATGFFIAGLTIYHAAYLAYAWHNRNRNIDGSRLQENWLQVNLRDEVKAVLRKKIVALRNANKDIQILAMGTTLKTIAELLDELGNIKDISIDAQLLLLSSRSSGSRFRAKLENRSPDELDKSIEKVLPKLVAHRERFSEQGTGSISLRTYQFVPGVYMVRINDILVVRPYLAEQGYFSPYFVIREGKLASFDGKQTNFFERFIRYFTVVFTSETLSQNLPENSPSSAEDEEAAAAAAGAKA